MFFGRPRILWFKGGEGEEGESEEEGEGKNGDGGDAVCVGDCSAPLQYKPRFHNYIQYTPVSLLNGILLLRVGGGVRMYMTFFYYYSSIVISS